MDFLKGMVGKVVTGLVALAVIAGGISWWQMDPATRQAIVSGSGKIASWLGIVTVLPWASFFVIGRVGKMESNLAGAMLVAGYTILEILLLAWLFDWHFAGASGWTMVGVGVLLSAAYNLFACDWIAEKME
ncbi:MAG TPA: hypothetical protein VHD56_12380 [Tepidisphaeraceae bacterium]|nr:hypothetical protein [Tepidisphaeraceae bacterium]